MKETKVYVDKMPEDCWDCLIHNGEDGHCKILNNFTDYISKDCPLIDIKDHDRELVKEVCEKIKEQLGFIVDGQERIVCYGSATGDKTILAVLNQIQKEYEK